MKKIPSLFVRDHITKLVIDQITPGTEWVIADEGIATRKWDGTACLVRDGRLYKRYNARLGRMLPNDFIPAQTTPDLITAYCPGWAPIGNGRSDRYHREAWRQFAFPNQPLRDGTYELCGPKVQGNPEGFVEHVLVPHGVATIDCCPDGFADLKEFLSTYNIDGVVWYHPDGRMAMIKGKDFGLIRKPSSFHRNRKDIME